MSLTLGDNLAINAKEGNVEGVDFYILMCTKKCTLCRNRTSVHGGDNLMHVTL
jgi:hypothetical protein